MIDLSHMKDRPVAVMGLGKSGLSTVEALRRAGVEVWAWDDGEAGRAKAEALGARTVELAGADLSPLSTLVWSPGIPHTHPKPHPAALRARAAGLEPVCDVELLARSQPGARTIGITGTNGKSTTTTLIGHVLEAAGRPVAVGGNLGTPVLTFPPFGAADGTTDGTADGTYVLEMSSYQLELTPSLVLDVALLLNITPDHLARHGGMDGYIAAKTLVFRGQTGNEQTRGQTAIVGIDDPHCRAIHAALTAEAGRLPGRRTVWPISAEGPAPGGVWAEDGWLIDDTDGAAARVAPLSDFPRLLGRHNWQNAAAAFAACKAAGVPPGAIVAAMGNFPGLAHRQQLVRRIGNVRFINDSKATNADATEKALATFEPIYWILGGQAKETGLDGLEGYMGRVRHAFLIGEATEPFARWLETNRVPHTRCGTLDVATRQAAAMALAEGLPGACVLLSPACASWDQFASFEKRGEAFADAVNSLGDGGNG